ncbi:hypothetical protein U9M48_025944 [Paspalum notatum var. saurae]|uniref:Uncharacterized protein n=1 Tax=Paspalum notatum var. saurae TaxID=547442 RepID=A0AAQ3TPX4_PASNO
MEMMIGSSAVRWLHTNSDPGAPGRGAGGGAPRTESRIPVSRYVHREHEVEEDAEQRQEEAHREVGQREQRVRRVGAADQAAVVEDGARQQRVRGRARGAAVGRHHMAMKSWSLSRSPSPTSGMSPPANILSTTSLFLSPTSTALIRPVNLVPPAHVSSSVAATSAPRNSLTNSPTMTAGDAVTTTLLSAQARNTSQVSARTPAA